MSVPGVVSGLEFLFPVNDLSRDDNEGLYRYYLTYIQGLCPLKSRTLHFFSPADISCARSETVFKSIECFKVSSSRIVAYRLAEGKVGFDYRPCP